MFLRHKWTAVLVGAALLPASPGYAAKEPLRLAPSSKWEVNYAPDSCRLARKFGEGDQQVFLMLDRFEPGESFKLSLAGKPVKLTDETRTLTIQFGPNELEQRISFYSGDYGKDMPALLLLENMRIAPPTKDELKANKNADFDELIKYVPLGADREAAVTSLLIGNPMRNPIILETGSMRGGFSAMEKCTDELLNHWGIDVQKHKNLKQAAKPKNSPGYWFTSDDYPLSMLAKRARSLVNFRLNIDQTGRPTACNIQASTRQIEFDQIVCKALMKRARFEPALAADGSPIATYFIGRVRFALP